MYKYVLSLLVFAVLMGYFFWGVKQSNETAKSTCEKEIIIKEMEVVRYVTKKKSYIYVQPNASRNELLKLMSENKL